MTTIVVGIEDSLRAQDAVALAGDLARVSGAEILAVCAFPFDERPAAHGNVSMREPLRAAAAALLERLCEPLSDVAAVRPVAVADLSPARALMTVAAAEQAALIVVGSTHTSFQGCVRPGRTGRRLLSGAPCAVALAPQGHRLHPHRARGRVTVGFDGSAGAHAALAAAAPLAQAAGCALRVVSVFAPDASPPPWLATPPGFLRITEDAERSARALLDGAVRGLPEAEPVFLHGEPARELAREAEDADLLLIGSRGYGPAPAVLLGAVSGRLMETAACPVLIVPNGAESLPFATTRRTTDEVSGVSRIDAGPASPSLAVWPSR
jgi:nucleotide-binding universal stress UspA family protein